MKHGSHLILRNDAPGAHVSAIKATNRVLLGIDAVSSSEFLRKTYLRLADGPARLFCASSRLSGQLPFTGILAPERLPFRNMEVAARAETELASVML